MNKVVNLQSVKAEKDAGIQGLQNFIESAVLMNKDQVAFTIANNNESPEHILNTYTDFLISQAFSNYSQEKLVSLISSGVLFQAREMLLKAFVDELSKQEAI